MAAPQPATFEKGTKVWYRSAIASESWVPAEIIDIVQEHPPSSSTPSRRSVSPTATTVYIVQYDSPEAGGSKKQAKAQTSELHPYSLSIAPEACADLVALNELTEAAILHVIRQRYLSDQIYTYVGPIVISVNPYRPQPNLYAQNTMDKYRGKLIGTLPPHLFALADKAFASLIAEGKNQAILITGESGAGKTEATKFILQYLAFASSQQSFTMHVGALGAAINTHANDGSSSPRGVPSPTAGMHTGELESKLLEANPILEAFGNAKTVRNNNSSRFGKFIKVFFDIDGHMRGVSITPYLLEKSRIVSQASSERNYHVFYQLLAAAHSGKEEQLKSALFLGTPIEGFHYLNQSGCYTIDGTDDAAAFAKLKHSMTVLGLSPADQFNIFKLLAAILHLGNIKFTQEGAANRSSRVANADELKIVSTLLGVAPTELETALCNRNMSARKSSVYEIPLTVAQAAVSRDSLAKALYGALFYWLVDKINASMAPNVNAPVAGPATPQDALKFIGVLDIFGFEIFESNSFEQLCINYANEKLQHFFSGHLFKAEQEEYIREGVAWETVSFHDNQECCDLLEKRPLGLLHLLDEECRFPKGTDKTFLSKIQSSHSQSRHFKIPRARNVAASGSATASSANCFTIAHYAGDVTYDTTGFLEKNKDTLHQELVTMLRTSVDPFVQTLLGAGGDGGADESAEAGGSGLGGRVGSDAKKGKASAGGSSATLNTLGSQFREQLTALVDELHHTEPHFVRCVKPNEAKAPSSFDASLILHQLGCLGILECVKVRRAGWSIRRTYEEFLDRFGILLHSSATAPAAGSGPPTNGAKDEVVRWLVKELHLNEHEVRFGKTKVFFREKEFYLLQKMRHAAEAERRRREERERREREQREREERERREAEERERREREEKERKKKEKEEEERKRKEEKAARKAKEKEEKEKKKREKAMQRASGVLAGVAGLTQKGPVDDTARATAGAKAAARLSRGFNKSQIFLGSQEDRNLHLLTEWWTGLDFSAVDNAAAVMELVGVYGASPFAGFEGKVARLKSTSTKIEALNALVRELCVLPDVADDVTVRRFPRKLIQQHAFLEPAASAVSPQRHVADCIDAFTRDWAVVQRKHARFGRGLLIDDGGASVGLMRNFADLPRLIFESDLAQQEATARERELVRDPHSVKALSGKGDNIDVDLDAEYLRPVTQDSRKKDGERRLAGRQPLYRFFPEFLVTMATPTDTRDPNAPPVPPTAHSLQQRMRLVVHFRELEFSEPVGPGPLVEPFFVTAALYDVATHRKLSEDFAFDYRLELVPTANPHFLTNSKRAVFFLPHALRGPSVYLVLRMEVVLKENGVDIDTYFAGKLKPKERSKFLEKIAAACTRLGRYRHPFAIAAVPVFDASGKLLLGKDTTLTSLVKLGKDDCLAGIGRDAADFCEKVVKKIASDKDAKKLKRFPAKLTLDVVEMPGNGSMAEDLYDATPPPPADPSPNSVKEVDAYLAIVPLASAGKSAANTPSPPVDTVYRQVAELGCGEVAEATPAFALEHHLYVYPISANLSSGPAKGCRNIAVDIQLKDTAASPHDDGMWAVYGKHGAGLLTSAAMTAVQYHNKKPNFYTEAKFRLPAVVNSEHHLLFTFKHVSCRASTGSFLTKKAVDPADIERPVGYAMLPLLGNAGDGRILDDQQHALYVAQHFPDSYMAALKMEEEDENAATTGVDSDDEGTTPESANPSLVTSPKMSPAKTTSGEKKVSVFQWLDKRPVFTVATKLVSTIQTQDRALSRYFSAYDAAAENAAGQASPTSTLAVPELIEALRDLRNIDKRVCARFLPVVLDQLFVMICGSLNAAPMAPEVSREAFSALLAVLNIVDTLTPKVSREYLMSYLHYLALSSPSNPAVLVSAPATSGTSPLGGGPRLLHEELCSHWVHLLQTTHSPNSEPIRVLCNYSWFFFELIIRSIVLALQPVGGGRSAANVVAPASTTSTDTKTRTTTPPVGSAPVVDPLRSVLPDSFKRVLVALVREVSLKIRQLAVSDQSRASVLNTSLSLFIKDCLSVLAGRREWALELFAVHLQAGLVHHIAAGELEAAHWLATGAFTEMPHQPDTNEEAPANPAAAQKQRERDEWSRRLIKLKFEFLRIFSDWEHFVELNNPPLFHVLEEGGIGGSSVPPPPQSAVTGIAAQMLTLEVVGGKQLGDFVGHYWREHFAVFVIISEIGNILRHRNEDCRRDAAATLSRLLVKHSVDPRYSREPEKLRAIANLYFPYLLVLVEDPRSLAHITNPSEKRDWLFSLLFILRHVPRAVLKDWWKRETQLHLNRFFILLAECLHAFEYCGEDLTLSDEAPSASHGSAFNFPAGVDDVDDPMGIQAQHRKTLSRHNTLKKIITTRLKQAVANAATHGPHGDTHADSPGTPRPSSPTLSPRALAALRDSHLGAEVSLIVLDVVVEFMEEFKDDLKAAIMAGAASTASTSAGTSTAPATSAAGQQFEALFNVLLLMLKKNNSTKVVLSLFDTLRSFIHHFVQKKLYTTTSSVCGDLTYEVLRFCNSRDRELRARACSILYLLLKKNWQNKNDINYMKLQCTIAVSKLVGEGLLQEEPLGVDATAPMTEERIASLSDTRFRRALESIAATAVKDRVNVPREFGLEVRQLFDRLFVVLANNIKLSQSAFDPERSSVYYLEIIRGHEESPYLQLAWLESLTNFHRNDKNWDEAAQCKLAVALMTWHYHNVLWPVTGLPVDKVTAAFTAVSPLLSTFRFQRPRSERDCEEAGLLKPAFSVKKLSNHLMETTQLLKLAESYEICIDVQSLLADVHLKLRDYRKVGETYKSMHQLCQRIIEMGQGANSRVWPQYYRVAFYGERWQEMDGKEYIYREKPSVRMGMFLERLQAQYAEHFGADVVHLLPNKDIVRDELQPDHLYYQVAPVEPYLSIEELAARPTAFEQKHNLCRFILETPFTTSGKSHGEVWEQKKRKIVLTTEAAFPHMVKRLRVVKREESILSPIEVAIELIQARTQKLKVEIEAVPPNPKTLQIVLQGSVLPTVNAGPIEIARVFVGGREPAAGTQPPEKVTQLAKELCEFVDACSRALEVNETLIGADQLLFHQEMLRGFAESKAKLREYGVPLST